MKRFILYFVILLGFSCQVFKDSSPTIDVMIGQDIRDEVLIDSKAGDFFQEEIVVLPPLDECPKGDECNVIIYDGKEKPGICDKKKYLNLANVKSICTSFCEVNDSNKFWCGHLSTATCCSQIAKKDSYDLQAVLCVPPEFCCKPTEKLCGTECCPMEWYCGADFKCHPQCEKNKDCNDGNNLTNDFCDAGVCSYEEKPIGPYLYCYSHADCLDGDFCTLDECISNQCLNNFLKAKGCECQPKEKINGAYQESSECNDNNDKTYDYCAVGICTHPLKVGWCLEDLECEDDLVATKIICDKNDHSCKLKCIHNCVEKECGKDDCGESCGTCKIGTFCNGWQQCQCDPGYHCKGKECGPDQCGGICGVCPAGYKCNIDKGKCQCIPKCEGKECGPDQCGGSCGKCQDKFNCKYQCNESTGQCELQDPCCNVECGWIGNIYCNKECPEGKICKAGKCKIPQLVCNDDYPYENYLCVSDPCGPENPNIQSSQPLQPNPYYGAYLQPHSIPGADPPFESWVKIKVPGIWKDADVLKIEFQGSKVCLKSIDSTTLDCMFYCHPSNPALFPPKIATCEEATIAGIKSEIIVDATQKNLSWCFKGKEPLCSPPEGFAPFGHFSVSKSLFQDGEIELFFKVMPVYPPFICYILNPDNSINICDCVECNCLSKKCTKTSSPNPKCLNCDFSWYCCPYLSFIKVVSCHYE